MNALCRFLACGALCLLGALAQAHEGGSGVDARQGLDAQRHHPPQDQPLHEMFYSKGHMPDNPSAGCCNEADCYPTEIKFVDGNTIVRRERPRQSRDHESLEPRDAGRRQGQGA